MGLLTLKNTKCKNPNVLINHDKKFYTSLETLSVFNSLPLFLYFIFYQRFNQTPTIEWLHIFQYFKILSGIYLSLMLLFSTTIILKQSQQLRNKREKLFNKNSFYLSKFVKSFFILFLNQAILCYVICFFFHFYIQQYTYFTWQAPPYHLVCY